LFDKGVYSKIKYDTKVVKNIRLENFKIETKGKNFADGYPRGSRLQKIIYSQ